MAAPSFPNLAIADSLNTWQFSTPKIEMLIMDIFPGVQGHLGQVDDFLVRTQHMMVRRSKPRYSKIALVRLQPIYQ
jgi:hypothetical protein